MGKLLLYVMLLALMSRQSLSNWGPSIVNTKINGNMKMGWGGLDLQLFGVGS